MLEFRKEMVRCLEAESAGLSRLYLIEDSAIKGKGYQYTVKGKDMKKDSRNFDWNKTKMKKMKQNNIKETHNTKI